MFAFGRKNHDPARLAVAPLHRFGSNNPPPHLDRSKWDFGVELGGNDVYPDCTTVGLLNVAKGIASLNGFEPTIDHSKVLPFYAGSIGVPFPGTDLRATDGAVLLDVLNYQSAHGFNIGNQSLVANSGVVTLSVQQLAWALARLGPTYLGVLLRQRDMDTVGQTWTVSAGRSDGAIVGGHCLISWDYTDLSPAGIVRLGTWGGWQKVTWAWVMARTEEAHGLVYRQLTSSQDYYLGLTVDGLASEL